MFNRPYRKVADDKARKRDQVVRNTERNARITGVASNRRSLHCGDFNRLARLFAENAV